MVAPSRRWFLTEPAAKLHLGAGEQLADLDPPGAAERVEIVRLEAERRGAGGVGDLLALVENVGDGEGEAHALQPGLLLDQGLALVEVGEDPGVHLHQVREIQIAGGARDPAHRRSALPVGVELGAVAALGDVDLRLNLLLRLAAGPVQRRAVQEVEQGAARPHQEAVGEVVGVEQRDVQAPVLRPAPRAAAAAGEAAWTARPATSRKAAASASASAISTAGRRRGRGAVGGRARARVRRTARRAGERALGAGHGRGQALGAGARRRSGGAAADLAGDARLAQLLENL